MSRWFIGVWAVGVFLIGGGIVWLSVNRQADQSQVVSWETEMVATREPSPSQEHQPQEYQFDQVGVTITPKQLVSGQKTVFSVAFDTHTVDLAYDFQEIAALKDETGEEYQLLEWTGGSGGHHLQGELVFEPLSDKTKSLTLTLSGIEDQSQEFTWETGLLE